MSKIRLMLNSITWWFRTPRMDEVVSVTSRATHRANCIEKKIRDKPYFHKIPYIVVHLIEALSMIVFSLVYYPICFFYRSHRRRDSNKLILFVSHWSVLNGAPTSLLAILQRLDRKEFSPIVLSVAEGPFVERSRELGIPTLTLPLSHSFGELGRGSLFHLLRLFVCMPYLFYLLSHFPIRVIHINSLVTPDAAIAGFLLRCKTIWHIREPRLETKWGRAKVAVVAALSHTIVANSKFTQNRIRSFGVNNNRVAKIYNFIKSDFLQSDAVCTENRKSFDVAQNDILVGCVGHVSRDKGQDIFVRAAIGLARKYDSVQFLIVGSLEDESFVAELRQLIDENYLTSRIRFTGVRDDIANVMRHLTVHVTPSRWDETFGRVAMEAMALGAVSIVSDRGGLPEIVENGISGLVFQAENPSDLAEKLDQLISDRDFRQRLSNAGRERALKVFSGDDQIAELHRIYRNLLN